MKRTIHSVVALCGAMALAACGSTVADTGAESTPSQAPAATGVQVGDTVDLAELAESTAAAVEAQGTSHVTVAAGGDGSSEIDVDYSSGSPAMSMTMTAEADEPVRMLLVDGVMYMTGDSVGEMTGGRSWIKIDPDGEDMMSRMMAPVLEQMASTVDPAHQFIVFEGTEAEVIAVDADTVTYSVVLTEEQLDEALDTQAESIPGLTKEGLAQMPDGMSYEMTLDAEGLPLSMGMDIAGEAVTVTYSDWGKKVDIAAPPASEVGTFQMPDLG
ncbi:hypothetical protein JQN72_11210 [Phycicoccus sp. CSK15P-2]|uniref:hypothetical protein n=1 Tax=Phycicoccus sp. CSK15P-2 TaxID=2807627 RepID=UPI00195274B5|nr:hypothetical protein [Phycicoccus sp. CSK15P-2]MBM6404812.1 hypothetical protein [Phycicoccus sp. CSK15P-2]